MAFPTSARLKLKSSLFAFALFDAGETILGALLFSTLYPLYITRQIDVRTYSFFYGFAFLISFIIALQLGKLADTRGLRKPLFTLFSLSVSGMGLMLFLTYSYPVFNFLLYLLLALFHQQALVFYNSLLMSFSSKGFASGLGVAMGYVASALALLFLAPHLSLPAAFLWVSLLFLLLSLPSLFALQEPEERQKVELTKLLKNRQFLLLIASVLLLMELAHTLIAMMGVYLREVFGLKDMEIYRVIGISAFGGVLGGLLFGRLTDKVSASKLFPLGFFLWSFFLLSLFFSKKEFLLPLGFFAGISLSHLWTTSRVLLLEEFSMEGIAVLFSFYSLSERIASSLGLISWSFFLLLTGKDYRLSALLMLVFPVAGAVLYWTVKKRL